MGLGSKHSVQPWYFRPLPAQCKSDVLGCIAIFDILVSPKWLIVERKEKNGTSGGKHLVYTAYTK